MIVLVAIFAPVIAPYDPAQQNIFIAEPAVIGFLVRYAVTVATFSRVCSYGRTDLLSIGFLSVLIAMVVGSALGILAGYIGGVLDQIVMGIVDVMLSFPDASARPDGRRHAGPRVSKSHHRHRDYRERHRSHVLQGTDDRHERVICSRPAGSLVIRPCTSCGCIFPQHLSDIVVVASLWMARRSVPKLRWPLSVSGVLPPTADLGGMIREGFDNYPERMVAGLSSRRCHFLTVLALTFLVMRSAMRSIPKTRPGMNLISESPMHYSGQDRVPPHRLANRSCRSQPHTSFRTGDGWKNVVRNLSFDIAARRRLHRRRVRFRQERDLAFDHRDCWPWNRAGSKGGYAQWPRPAFAAGREMRRVRGNEISMIFQER